MTMTLTIFDAVKQKTDRESFVRSARMAAAHQTDNTRSRNYAQTDTPKIINLCLMLHKLAQKYVPRTPQTFRDFDALTQVSRALQKMGVNIKLAADVCAPAQAVETAVVLNSPEYRLLHNRFVAALATIADMTERNSPPGSFEYQRGVREGYRRASDIAILFLEDLHAGTK